MYSRARPTRFLVTKYRHRAFADRHLARREEVTRAVCTDFECELVERGGEPQHVHLLISFPRKVALEEVVVGPVDEG